MLNDDEISCEWPTAHPSIAPINLIYSTSLTKLARLISLVMRKSSSVAALQQSPHEFAEEIADLEHKKNTFENFIAEYIPLDSPTSPAYPTSGLDVRQTLSIRMLYYVLVASIHTILTNPWSRCGLKATSESVLKHQIDQSTNIVVTASRNAILAAQDIRIDAGTPNL